MQKWLKYTLFGFVSLLFLMAGIVAFTQTRPFKDWLRDKIVQEASKKLDGTLEIGSIDGNLIRHFEISNLIIRDAQDTILSAPKLSIRLLPGRLLDRQIVLQVVAMDSPRVIIQQKPDSLWNVSTLVKETETETEEEVESSTWYFSLENMAVTNADIRVIPLKNIAGVPQRIAGLNATLSLAFQKNILSLDLKNLRFKTHEPEVALQNLSFSSTFQNNTLAFDNIALHLRETQISATCQFSLSVTPDFRFQLNANPISLDEIQQFYPDLPLSGKVTVAVEGVYQGDSLRFTSTLSGKNSRIHTEVWLQHITTAPEYSLNSLLENVDLTHWVQRMDSSMAHRLTGTVAIKGVGIDADSAVAELKIKLRNSSFQGIELNSVDLTGKYSAGNANFILTSNNKFGNITLSGEIDDAVHHPRFDLSGNFEQINIAKLMPSDTMETDINLFFSAKGQGLQPDSLVAEVQFNLAPSHVAGIEIDTVFCSARIERQDFAIDTLQVECKLGNFYLAGKVSLASENDLRFRGEVGDLLWVASKMNADTLFAKGTFYGHLQGKMAALNGEMSFKLHEISYNAATIDSLTGNAFVEMISDSLHGQATMYFDHAGISEVLIDSIYFRSTFWNNKADFEVAFSAGKDISGQTKLTLLPDTTSRIDISELQFQYKNRRWTNNSDPFFLIAGDTYSIQNLSLVNNNQQITAEGTLNLNGRQDFKFKLRNIDIPDMIQMARPSFKEIAGKLNLDSHLTGTRNAPQLTAKIQVRNGRLTNVEYDSLNMKIDYENALLKWLFQLHRDESLLLRGDGYLPLDVVAADRVGKIDTEKPFRFQVATQGIDLSFLQSFVKDIKDLQGLFVCDVRIENTLNNPVPVGHFSVFNGALRFPQYGMKYRDIQARLQVDKESIRVTEFDIGTEVKVVKGFWRKKNKKQDEMRGRMWIVPGSHIDFDSTGFLGGVDLMNLTLKTHAFQLANSSDYQAQISGEVKILGDARAPRFEGKMNILRSSLYLPALEETGLYDEEKVKSLLTGIEEDTTIAVLEDDAGESSTYFNNLRGRLKIEIPKNAWIRSPEMNVELSGSLDLVKDGPEFEQPFGTIQVIRGTYDLLGAYKFEIEDGNLFLEGGQDFNPKLDIKAKHSIRTRDRNMIELILQITGRVFSPALKFWRDGEEIDVTEAVSTLLTGGRRGSATSGKGLLAGSGSKEATGVLAGLLTSQLSKFLLNNQVLDVLEVKGDLTGDQASIVLGKYITNKLFLSLEKAIKLGNGNDDGIRDEVTIEYALSRYIILQAIAGDEKTTGFDIFWKFSK